MTKTVTLSELRDRIRQRGEWRSNYISDSELNDHINNASYKLYNLESKADPLRNITSDTVSTTSGTEEYDLPSDFNKAVGIYKSDSTTDGYTRLQSFNFEERYDTNYSDTTRYAILGPTISGGNHRLILNPIPTSVETIKVDYIPAIADLGNDSDVIDTVNGLGIEYIISDVAIFCAAKEESDITPFVQQKQDIEKVLAINLSQDESKNRTTYSDNTLKAMQLAVRNRGNWPREAISDAQLTLWINEACQKFYSMVAAVDPLRYVSTGSTTVVSGTKEYDLPSDFFRMLGVSVQDSSTEGYSQIERYNFEERYDEATSTAASTRYIVHGEDQDGGHTIELQPTPTWDGTLRLEYVKTFTRLTNSDSMMDTINGVGKEWIISDAAMKASVAAGTPDLLTIFDAAKKESQEILLASMKQDISFQKTTPTAGTLRNLQLTIRNRINIPHEKISDNQLTSLINASIGGLTDVIYASAPTSIMTYSTISVVADTDVYDLPSDFYKLMGVSVTYAADRMG